MENSIRMRTRCSFNGGLVTGEMENGDWVSSVGVKISYNLQKQTKIKIKGESPVLNSGSLGGFGGCFFSAFEVLVVVLL